MRDQQAAFERAGAHIIVVSPDESAPTRQLADDLGVALGVDYSMVCDPDRRVATTFGVARDGDVAPAAFLLDRRGAVQWSFIGRHPADQPPALAALAALGGPGTLAVPGPSGLLTPAIAAMAAIMAVTLGVLAASANRHLLVWDLPVQEFVGDVTGGWLGSVLAMTNRLGSRWVIGALTLPMVLIAWNRCRQLAVVLIVALPAGLLLEVALKTIVDRPRPAMADGFGSSFPSGHVLAAAAFWGLTPPWSFVVTRRRWVWAVATGVAAAVIVAVGLSRIYVGAHWPSDVLGGYVIGAIFLLGAEWAVRRPSKVLRCESCDLHPMAGTRADSGLRL